MLNSRSILLQISLLLISLCIGSRVQAQEDQRAGVLRVIYPGVELQRAGTETWWALPLNAITPIGLGDHVRTNEGRVSISFDEVASLYLLPGSTFTLDSYQTDKVEVTLTGISIHQVTEALSSYQVQLWDAHASLSQGTFGIWSYEADIDSVIAIAGSATVEINENNIELEALQGYLEDLTNAINLEASPYNRARLIATQATCQGVITTNSGQKLFVRSGAGTGFIQTGTIKDGEAVRLLALTESGLWARIQFLNGFGWLNTSAIKSDCNEDVPRLPDAYQELSPVTIINPSEEELTLLDDFFFSPAFDGFFYQYRN